MICFVYCALKLSIGTLYPAYESFKAVKNRHVKEYIKWMTYWIVFSLLSLVEEVTDLFLAWLPLYTPIKIGILIWLISPTTRGASVVYRGLVHPNLVTREEEIDQFIQNLVSQAYTTTIRYAQLAAQKFTKTMIETAIKGGGGLVTTLKRSVSMNDLDQSEDEFICQENQSVGRIQKMTKSWHETYEDEEQQPRRKRNVPYGRQRQNVQREDDFRSEARSEYTTLPRAAKNGSRSQLGETNSSGRPLPLAKSKSISRQNLSTLPQTRRRISRMKGKILKPTEKDSEFSMSYSDTNSTPTESADKKRCRFM